MRSTHLLHDFESLLMQVSACLELLKKLDEEVRKNATPSEEDNDGRTVLHLAVIRRLPGEFTVALIRLMGASDVNQRDNSERTALDYFVSSRILHSTTVYLAT